MFFEVPIHACAACGTIAVQPLSMASLAASYSKWDTWNDESDDDTVEVRDGAARAQARLARARGLVAGTTEPEARPVPQQRTRRPGAGAAPPSPSSRALGRGRAAQDARRGCIVSLRHR